MTQAVLVEHPRETTAPSVSSKLNVQTRLLPSDPQKLFYIPSTRSISAHTKKIWNLHIVFCSKSCNAKGLFVGRLLELSAFSISYTTNWMAEKM